MKDDVTNDLEILKTKCPHNTWLWRKSHPNYCADCGLYAVAVAAKLQADNARLIARCEAYEAALELLKVRWDKVDATGVSYSVVADTLAKWKGGGDECGN